MNTASATHKRNRLMRRLRYVLYYGEFPVGRRHACRQCVSNVYVCFGVCGLVQRHTVVAPTQNRGVCPPSGAVNDLFPCAAGGTHLHWQFVVNINCVQNAYELWVIFEPPSICLARYSLFLYSEFSQIAHITYHVISKHTGIMHLLYLFKISAKSGLHVQKLKINSTGTRSFY